MHNEKMRRSRKDPPPRPVEVRITARFRSRCLCGTWVHPGQVILWDTKLRKTCGCATCRPQETEEHPDPWAYADDDPWMEVL